MLFHSPIIGRVGAAGLLPQDVFATNLYIGTADGSAKIITNGINFATEGGLVWLKHRNQTGASHVLQDTIRGTAASTQLSTDSNAAAAAKSSVGNRISAFNSNGFTISGNVDQASGDPVHSFNNNHVAWSFRRAPKFFDVVTYTGDGVAGRTIVHNLGAVPGMIIVKRFNIAGDWAVYHRSTSSPADKALTLNSTAAENVGIVGYWNSTAPSASVFTVGNNGEVNGSGNTYVAYLFAHDAASDGIVQCGSYAGNGGTNTINLGWQPQFLVIKNATDVASWYMLDTTRGIEASDKYLVAETSGAEASFNLISVSSTGFSIDAYGGIPLNDATDTYIYLAIRAPI